MNVDGRLHALDGLRAVALLLGIALHASMSFIPGMIPGIWATVDSSPSATLGQFFFVTHIFRMTLFFVIAGFFARLLMERRGAAGFWKNRLVRIAVPLAGDWVVVYPAITAVWMWGLRDYFGGQVPAIPPEMVRARPADAFPLAHLWFLYYLLLTYVAVTLVRGGVARLDGHGTLRNRIGTAFEGLVRSGLAPLVLAAPLAVVLYRLPVWLAGAGIPTPDGRLLPQLAPMVGYGTAVAVGWMLHRQAGALLPLLTRRWALNLAIAIAFTLVCIQMTGGGLKFAPEPMAPRKALLAACYVIACWGWTFGLIGGALRFFPRESAVRRYVADSSYWLYLAHLPVVAAGAVIVRAWPLHWSVKFALVLGGSLAVLFASYHLLVRPTFIGQVLNGRRVPLFSRKRSAAPVARELPGAVAPAGEAVAELRGAVCRYGKVTALDHVTMDLRRGELLALLGPNGAGKSTAISLWLGLQQPHEGEARLVGGSPLEVAQRRHIGVMMQDVQLAMGMRVRELVSQASSYYAAPREVADTLRLAGVEELANRYYDKLSGGQKRQVQFALAVCGRPSVLFLDEPSVGLDIEARTTMWRAVRALVAEGCSVLLTTHYLEEAEALADRVIVLAHGRVVAAGSVDEIRAVVSRREIRCTSRLSAETLASWPGVLEARRDDAGLRLTVIDAEPVLRRLLAEDATLGRLEVKQAGLAEAFVHLTREAA